MAVKYCVQVSIAAGLVIALQVSLTVVRALLRRQLATTVQGLNESVNLIVYGLVQVPAGIFVAVFLGFEPRQPAWVIGAIFLGSIIFPLRAIILYKISEFIEASVITVYLNLSTVFTVILAAVVLNDNLGVAELVGATLILFAAVMVSLSSAGRLWLSGLSLIMILSIVGLESIGNVYEGWAIESYKLSTYLVYGLLFQACWAAILFWPKRAQFKLIRGSGSIGTIVSFSFARGVSGLLFLTALSLTGSIATVKSLVSVSPVLITLAAFIFLNEKDHAIVKFGAAIIASAGLLIFAV